MDLVTKASTTSSVHTDLQVSTLFESLSGYSVQKAWEINANEANKKKTDGNRKKNAKKRSNYCEWRKMRRNFFGKREFFVYIRNSIFIIFVLIEWLL